MYRARGCARTKQDLRLDGFISNAPMDEGGTGIPNVDAIAEFSVEMNFSAENGRDPMQVRVATKSGTNEYHGSAWEFNQNDAYNARNTLRSAPRVCAITSSAARPAARFSGTRLSSTAIFRGR